jgi:hypothetical protein
MLLAGLGTITPAFVVADATQARSAEDTAIATAQSGAPTTALDQEALKSALLALTPTEKLRIAGDRIRLAKSMTKSNIQSTQKGARAAATAGFLVCGPTVATCPTQYRLCGVRAPSQTLRAR